MLSKGSLDKLHVHGHTMDSWSNWEEEEEELREGVGKGAAQYTTTELGGKEAAHHSALRE